MSKAKLQAARELIEEKNYHAARTVLVTVDDPVARQWLAKLDRLAPVYKPESRRWLRFVLGGVIGLALLALVVVGSLYVLNGNVNLNPDRPLLEQVDSYCRRFAPRDVEDIAAYCRQQTPAILAENETTVRQCYARSSDGQDPRVFMECMYIALNMNIDFGS